MAKDTLYTAQRLLHHLITIYGFIESNKPYLKTYNRMAKRFFISFLVMRTAVIWFILDSAEVNELEADYRYRVTRILLLEKLTYGVNLACFCLLHLRKRTFSALLNQLKGYEMDEKVAKKIKRFSAYFFAFFFLNFFLTCCQYATFYIETTFYTTCFLIVWGVFNQLLCYCLPACALLVCLVSYYVNCTVKERTEEVKKSKSPLRRGRLTTRLILLSTRLNPLIKTTNHYGAPLMLLLRMTATMIPVLAFYLTTVIWHEDGLDEAISNLIISSAPFLISCLFYLCYLKVAPSNNQIPCLLARVMAENVLSDDQSLSREPISRSPLLRTRWLQLAHLTHSNFNQEQLTVLGEPVDETDILMVFVDLSLNFNAVNSFLP